MAKRGRPPHPSGLSWYERNKERAREESRLRNAAYRAANPQLTKDKERARAKVRHAQGGEKELERLREKSRRWRANNPHRDRARKSEARRDMHNRTPLWFGEFDLFVVDEAHDIALKRQQATGTGWHVDHMYPLKAKTVSGLHCGLNIQVIPASLNISKSNRLLYTEPHQWLAA